MTPACIQIRYSPGARSLRARRRASLFRPQTHAGPATESVARSRAARGRPNVSSRPARRPGTPRVTCKLKSNLFHARRRLMKILRAGGRNYPAPESCLRAPRLLLARRSALGARSTQVARARALQLASAPLEGPPLALETIQPSRFADSRRSALKLAGRAQRFRPLLASPIIRRAWPRD